MGGMEATPEESGPPPTKCPNPNCGVEIGFDLESITFQYKAAGTRGELAATHRVAKWACRQCGCEVSFYHKMD
jgi:hypothetical protein